MANEVIDSMEPQSSYVDHGDHFTLVVDKVAHRCVSCGRPIEYVKTEQGQPGAANHHCSTKYEGDKRGASIRGEEPLVRRKPYWERLEDGFRALNDDA